MSEWNWRDEFEGVSKRSGAITGVLRLPNLAGGDAEYAVCTEGNGWLWEREDLSAEILVRKPKPPVYVPWGSIHEVPFDHWFRRKNYDQYPIQRVCTINSNSFRIPDGGMFSLAVAFSNLEHAADPIKGPWLPCGKVAT